MNQCPEGVVAIARHTLRIFSVDRLGVVFNQVLDSLNYLLCDTNTCITFPSMCMFVCPHLNWLSSAFSYDPYVPSFSFFLSFFRFLSLSLSLLC